MIKADTKVRRLMIEVCAIGVLVVIVLMQWVLPWAMRHLQRQEPRVVLWVVEAVTAGIFLSVIPMALYLYRFGRRVVRHRQIPPPGTRVIMDTKLVEGERAVMRGRIVMMLAVLLLALSLFGGLYFPYRLERLFAGKLAKAPAESTQQSETAEQPARGTTP